MQVELTKTAEKQLDRLNEPHRSRIVKAIDRLENEPPEGDIIKLTDREGYRVRVGDYRIFFVIDNNCISIYKIGSRENIYKK